MGDRSYVAGTVFACADDKKAEVRRIVADYVELEDGEEVVGADLTIEEASLGTAGEMASLLILADPSVVFAFQQEPKYEHNGDLHLRTPELGYYARDCTSTGTPIVEGTEVLKVLSETPLAGVREAVETLYGVPWVRALAAYGSPWTWVAKQYE